MDPKQFQVKHVFCQDIFVLFLAVCLPVVQRQPNPKQSAGSWNSLWSVSKDWGSLPLDTPLSVLLWNLWQTRHLIPPRSKITLCQSKPFDIYIYLDLLQTMKTHI
jgi:hypothetical protein